VANMILTLGRSFPFPSILLEPLLSPRPTVALKAPLSLGKLRETSLVNSD